MTAARDLAALVRAKRGERGWSREVLARRIGCSAMTIFNIEDGRVTCPRPRIAKGLMEHLGLSAEQLMGVKKNPTGG